MLRADRPRLTAALAITMLAAACGGGPAATPTPVPPTAPPAETSGPIESAAATQGATGPASLEAVDEIEAGKEFDVSWTGPNGPGDYVTIVLATAAKWTNEDYFYTTIGTPGKLTAPSADGAYSLWYVSGADDAILARRPLTVTPFQGALLGPDEIPANTRFEVAWNGPNGPGDYITIVKAGSTRWTNESYFYTTVGSPGPLLADLEPGAYELWYVIGADSTIQARRPITVTAVTVTLDAPDTVVRGTSFEVTWTGPDGTGDFVTIVPVGAAPSAYLGYFYTTVGSPGPLKAPDDPGAYEIRYIPGQEDVVLLSIPITVN